MRFLYLFCRAQESEPETVEATLFERSWSRIESKWSALAHFHNQKKVDFIGKNASKKPDFNLFSQKMK